MITETGKLAVLENFQTDRSLPKFKRAQEAHSFNTRETAVMGGTTGGTAGLDLHEGDALGMPSNFIRTRSVDDLAVSGGNGRRSVFNVVRRVFSQWGKGKKKVKHVLVDYENVEQFFSNMHIIMKDLKIQDKDVGYYSDLVKNATALGQVALAEKLMSQRGVLLSELSMIKEHKVRYVTGAEIVAYYKKAKHSKHLNMTWIKNYARIIPADVVGLKMECDEKGWFDNYAVLHFDRRGDSAEMTVEEKRRAKDPILFGLVENSDRLYYVADWTDEYCDLTLDKMLKVIGEDALELNKASLRKMIEKIKA